MANSPLVTYTRLSPNHSGKRTHTIDRITPHAVVGQLSVERICDCFRTAADRQAATTASGLTAESDCALMSRTVHGVLHQGIMTNVPSPSSAPLI